MDNKIEKIKRIIAALQQDIAEKDEVIAVSLLAALAGQNIFLLGPPGTAKSLIARRLASVFQTGNYFDYLMQRFSTPEEVFGPVKLSELKKDNYIRKTEGYLPEADVAFLDEIWKSSPAILNTLLTILNEKKFRNGGEIKGVPLKVLVSASNETPPENQGLDALYDRFLVRLFVAPIADQGKFERVIGARQPAAEQVELADSDKKITNDQIQRWQKEIGDIKLSSETLEIIRAIRIGIEEKNKKKKEKQFDVYVSDRRWQRASQLLKAAAFFCGRKETNKVDALLLRHCLWTDDKNRDDMMEIVEDAVRQNRFNTAISLSDLEKERSNLDKDIQKYLFNTEDIYKTVSVKNEKFFKFNISDIRYYDEYHGWRDVKYIFVPENKVNTSKEFPPLDEDLNELDGLKCSFKGGANVVVKSVDSHGLYIHKTGGREKSITRMPTILTKKGSVKSDVSSVLTDSYKKLVDHLGKKVDKNEKQVESLRDGLKKKIATPFVPERERGIALESVDGQLDDIQSLRTQLSLMLSKIEEAEKHQS